MTGAGAQQCGVGIDQFRVAVTDKQIVESRGHPTDAPLGLKTFPNDKTGSFNLSAPIAQYAEMESTRVKAPPRTDYGWLGQTPAGTDNFFGLGVGSGSEGYVDSGPHPEMPDRARAPKEWTKSQLAVFWGGSPAQASGGISDGARSVGSSAAPSATGSPVDDPLEPTAY